MSTRTVILFASILLCSASPGPAVDFLFAPVYPPGRAAAVSWAGGALDLEARVECQRALEEVRFNHRIWPSANPGPKPPLADVLPESELRRRAGRTVLLSNALDRVWQRPVSDAQLRAELARIRRDTKAPELLGDLERALGGSGYLLAECLARPSLVDRLARTHFLASGEDGSDLADGSPRSLDAWLAERRTELGLDLVTDPGAWEGWTAPRSRASGLGAVGDSWAPTAALPEGVSGFSLVWTGTEMIAWGGDWNGKRDTGSRYDPATDSWTMMSVVGAPSPRIDHTAVWTGTEMIVWGGCGQVSNFCELGSGARYDPLADSWTALPASSVGARRFHTAIWTGSEMIVWGGCRTGSFGNNACEISLGAAERYAPASNSWTPGSTVGEPSPRIGHKTVWTGTEMIVWGGFAGSNILNSGGRYDPSADSWSPTATASAPSPRGEHTAVWSGAKMIVWGGRGPGVDNPRLGDGGRYDPATNSWEPVSLTDAPAARHLHSAVWSGSEMIVWGGSGNGPAFPLFQTGGRYDPQTDDWTPTTTTNAPPAREDHRVVWTGAEMIVWGGLFPLQPKSGGRYDPVTDSWLPTSLDDPRRARQNHVAVWTGAEMLLWGGDILNSGGGDGDRYDPATDSWTAMSDTGQPSDRRHGLAAIWTGTEMIVWGGQYGTVVMNTGGRYNPTTDSWQATSTIDAPTPRAYAALVWSGSRMIVWGGSTDAFATATGGLYDPATNTWTATSLAGAPPAGAYLSGVWTDSRAIFWGGLGASGDLDTGGLYDPATDIWTPVSTTGAPSPRHFHTALWTGSRLLIWGGMEGFLSGGTYLSTGGLYDPATGDWTSTTLVGAPSGRIWHASVWTGQEAIVWGGCRDGSSCDTGLSTGARYDPQSDVWAATATLFAPSARSSHTGVWAGTRMIVWGGLAESYGSFTSTGGLYTPPSGIAIFLDGFESGDTTSWSLVLP